MEKSVQPPQSNTTSAFQSAAQSVGSKGEGGHTIHDQRAVSANQASILQKANQSSTVQRYTALLSKADLFYPQFPPIQRKSIGPEMGGCGMESSWGMAPKEPPIQLHAEFSAGEGIVQRISVFSKVVIETLIPLAMFKMHMMDEAFLNMMESIKKYLNDNESADDDVSEAFQAFLFIYTHTLGMGERYLIVAEAFRMELMGMLMDMERKNQFPAKTVRKLALMMHNATKSQQKRVEELRGGSGSPPSAKDMKDVKDSKSSKDEKGAKSMGSMKMETGSSSESEDEPEPVEEKTLMLDRQQVEALLKKSSPFNPLSHRELISLDAWLKENVGGLSRPQSADLRKRIKQAHDDFDAYEASTQSTRPKGSSGRKRKGKAKVPIPKSFDTEDQSELSSEESDPDKRLAKHPVPMASIMGRSHVYGVDDHASFRYLVTGLPYADTYLGLFKNGSIVPRLINGKPNIKGFRKRMREAEAKLKDDLARRDQLFAELDKQNAILATKPVGDPLIAATTARDAAHQALTKLLYEKIRPIVEGLVFGSSIRPTEQDISATEAEDADRTKIKGQLVSSPVPNAASNLMKSRPPGGITTGADTGTHAEQSLLSTQLWQGLVNTMVKAISSNKDKPEEIRRSSFTHLKLVLNRSTCIGCARELMAELIRFWTMVANSIGLDDWRRAKFIYEDYIEFSVEFPSIYEVSAEKSSGFSNLKMIVAGLRDAGWQIRMPVGIKQSADADEAQADMAKLVHGQAAIPMFYVPNWDHRIQRFPIPESLKKALETSAVIRINGISYWVSGDKKALTRNPDAARDDLSEAEIGKVHFLPTGVRHSGAENEDEKKQKRGKLGTEFDKKKGIGSNYDPALTQMLSHGYRMQNVSGSGMNCLIRSIFTAAGVNFDEQMVSIARKFLVDLGVAVDGDMLDLLDVGGVSLVHFLRRQGVLGPNVGITVHFPGDSMVAVPGTTQLHLWLAGAHFQAIVRQ